MATTQRPRRLVGVSTKMYFSLAKTQSYVDEVVKQLQADSSALDSVDVFLIPDFISLSSTIAKVRDTKIIPGAQDCFWEDTGAYTGEVSPAFLAEAGCRIVELGHAERRRIFGETDVEAAKKATAVSRNGMIPLVCIGEKTKGEVSVAVSECSSQVLSIIDAVPDDAEIIFAYEPVWAIGQSEPAGAEHVVGVAKELRRMASKRRGTTRFLYGGSAGPGLFAKLSEGLDGLFLGRFAHDPAQFKKTIDEVAAA